MADEAVEPFAHLGRELGRFMCELLDGLGKAMAHLDVLAVEVALELVVMVADHDQACSRFDHVLGDPEHVGRARAAVDQVADEDGATAFWWRDVHLLAVPSDDIAEFAEQHLQLVGTAMNIADYVERAGLIAAIGPQLGSHDFDRIDILDRSKAMHIADAFAVHAAERALEALRMAPHRAGAELTLGPRGIAGDGDLLGKVEQNRDHQRMPFPGQRD